MIPLNPWLILLLGALALNTAARFALGRLNARSLKEHGREIPSGFEGEIDAATLSRITDYTLESSRFSAVEGLFDDLLLVAVVLSGLVPWFAGLLAANLCFVPAGLAFYGALFLLSAVLDIPFSVYGTFVIEKKHGFSTITFSTWVMDLLKGAALSIALMGILLAVFLFLLESTRLWWLWAWAFFSAFQALMLWLYPVLIAPMFNKFEPLADEGLREQIVALMEKRGLKIEGVFQVDAGKRSRHTNAYFTGIGRTKRIVLFDTLLESHTADEVLAVLAHELGHWRRRHVVKQLVLMACVSLLVLYGTAWLMRLDQFYFAFGFREAVPFAGLFFAGVILKPLAFFFTPLGAGLSRRFERQADADACELATNPRALAAAFRRLAKDNLANLHPHPLYAWFYYSHPPLVERVRAIEACAEKAP